MAKKDNKPEIEKWFKIIVDRINEKGPDAAPDWGGSVQFLFPDLQTGWLLKLTMEGEVEFLEEKVDENYATAVIEMDSDSFLAIYNKTKTPTDVFTSGKMQIRKSIEALTKVLPMSADM